MPHVVLQGAPPLRELVASFLPLEARLPVGIVKFRHAYLEREGDLAHFPALTVSGELRQAFLVLVTQREAQLTVRLDPLTDPERTPAVLAALAVLALHVAGPDSGARVVSTNMEPALSAARAALGR